MSTNNALNQPAGPDLQDLELQRERQRLERLSKDALRQEEAALADARDTQDLNRIEDIEAKLEQRKQDDRREDDRRREDQRKEDLRKEDQRREDKRKEDQRREEVQRREQAKDKAEPDKAGKAADPTQAKGDARTQERTQERTQGVAAGKEPQLEPQNKQAPEQTHGVQRPPQAQTQERQASTQRRPSHIPSAGVVPTSFSGAQAESAAAAYAAADADREARRGGRNQALEDLGRYGYGGANDTKDAKDSTQERAQQRRDSHIERASAQSTTQPPQQTVERAASYRERIAANEQAKGQVQEQSRAQEQAPTQPVQAPDPAPAPAPAPAQKREDSMQLG